MRSLHGGCKKGGTAVSRKETTAYLSRLIEEHINPHNDTRVYFAKEVTFDYGSDAQVRVDYMKFKPVNNTVSGIEKGDFYCYEVKSCKEDFASKNGHNFIGDFNYYVMPHEVYDEVRDYIPYNVGVLSPSATIHCLVAVKNARRCSRTRPVSEMLLMMFRSANRDNFKSRKWGVQE